MSSEAILRSGGRQSEWRGHAPCDAGMPSRGGGSRTPAGYGDLQKFTRVRETPFTQDVLIASMTRVQNAAGSYLTTLDSDIRTGRVLATAANAGDVASVRSAIAALQPPLRASGVIVKIGRFVDTARPDPTP